MGNITSILVITFLATQIHSFQRLSSSHVTSFSPTQLISDSRYISSPITITSLFDTASDIDVSSSLVHTNRDSSQTVVLFESVDQWLRSESLCSLVSKADMMNILVEMRTNELRYQRLYVDYSRRFDGLVTRLKTEQRSLKQIIDSPGDVKNLLDFVETVDIADPIIVKLLLQDQMPLFENMLGMIIDG